MKTTLEKHNKSLTAVFGKLFEVEVELTRVSREIEKNISNTPSGDFRNTLTDINIMLNEVIYKNFR